jgi:hypothetical protein
MTVFMANVFNFLNRSSTTTVTFSQGFNLIPMLNQEVIIQPIPRSFIQKLYQCLISLSTGVSFQFLGSEAEDVSLNDSVVGLGQPTERKTKNLWNIGLDIETVLREFEEENPSRRISEG